MTQEKAAGGGCLFCAIAAGRASAHIVHETARLVAFLDIAPIRPGHLQIVPRAHYPTFETLPPELTAEILHLGQDFAGVQRRLYGALNDQQSEHVGHIHHSGQLLLSLVDDLLDLAVAEAGRDLCEGPVDLCALLAGCVKLLEPRAASKGVSLHIELPARPVSLLGDEVKLKQVILNLLTNAVKFTPAPGRVTAQLSDPAEAAHDATADGDIRIVIADSGIGISSDEIDHVLQPFGQAHDNRANAHQGAGLGLPLAKALTELHGGTLAIDSRLHVGTSVVVTLPAARRLATPPSIEDQATSPATASGQAAQAS